MKNIPRILVVDDDPNLRKTLADIMRVKGYEVAVAANGAEGVAQAERAFVNVALIDLKLPDLSGIEVMTRIKRATPLTEAIILTGHADMETAIEATNKGAFSYLLKPYEIDKLLRHILRALDKQQTQQKNLWLASFPNMNPNPVLEVNAAGDLTYLNPAAEKIFPTLAGAHPTLDVLGDISATTENGKRQEVMRELKVGNATFEQFLYPVPESDLIRIYMLDISARKQHEIKLNRLNLLLLTLRSINEYMLAAESEQALYRFVCEALIGLEEITGVIISMRLPNFVLQPVAWSGFGEAMIASLNIRWDDSALGGGIMGAAAREGKLVGAADIENDVRCAPWREIVQTWNLKSAAAVPLIAEGETIGVLAVYSEQRNAFDQETTDFVAEIANDIAIGVHSLRQDKRLHATLISLRKSLDGTVEAVARLVELRDPYTAGHQRRVAQLASAIGTEMGLPERKIEGLRVIGFLHDIGKIAVPAEILSKPTTLSTIEIAMVRNHSQAGYDTLKDLEFPWPVAQAVLQHHERLDGSGYPQGLHGDEIILEARILMVADVIEAMASHRPYRASRGLDTAIKEITSHKGTRFDPVVVDACVRIFAEHRFSLDEGH